MRKMIIVSREDLLRLLELSGEKMPETGETMKFHDGDHAYEFGKFCEIVVSWEV